MKSIRPLTAILSLCAIGIAQISVRADELPDAGRSFDARDTLAIDVDSNADAEECLEGLRWQPGPFTVRVESVTDDRGDRLVRFPSPNPSGDDINDDVSMEWYVARDDDGQPKRAYPFVIVHESGRGMAVGRIFARGLQGQGFHTFLIHLPGYGARKSERTGNTEFLQRGMQQAIGDVRRARDAVAALPLVDSSNVGLHGTSLGGFITSTVAGLDGGFDHVFILLAGGDLHKVVLNGQKDAAKVRERLAELGVADEAGILKLTRPVEPLRVAHRILPERTWLYSGRFDDVVPPECSHALASAAKLPPGHHIELPADHYSGVILLPAIIIEMRRLMLDEPLVPSNDDPSDRTDATDQPTPPAQSNK